MSEHENAANADEALADRLRSTLQDDGVEQVELDEAMVPAVRARAAQRRQRKVLGLALVLVLALLGGTSAMALTRSSSTGTIDLAAPSTSGTRGPGSSASSASDLETTTTADAGTSTEPPTTEATPTQAPSTSVPDVTTAPPRSSIPITTIPISTDPTVPTTPNTPPPQAIGVPMDCGTSSPSGFPTTTMARPDLSKCLLDAFASGQSATLRVVTYAGGDSSQRTEKVYTVIGVHVVSEQTSSTVGAPTTFAPTTRTCGGLTDIWPDAQLVRTSNCS